MKWKEFLKPDLKKVIIFIILSLSISYYAYNWLLNNLLTCRAIGCPTVEEIALQDMILLAPIILIVNYLLSCLIFWIYDKSKKK